MQHLWTYLQQKPWRATTKYRLALFLFSVLSGLLGLACWLLIRLFALDSWDWMACFIGYPVVASWVGVFLKSCQCEFQDGCLDK